MSIISKATADQKDFFRQGHTKPYEFRLAQLKKLKKMLKKWEPAILEAVNADLNKSEYEAYTTEVGFLYSEIDDHMKHLEEWMEPIEVKTPLTHKGSKNYIIKEPYGNVLVIAPWNYPINLAFAPVIGAIAAGNTVILKPSELTPKVSSLLEEMVAETFEPGFFTVIEGGKETSQALLDQRFDYIFFTGSIPVGKIVMEKASKHLTPVTLELGGKSPAIVHKDAKLDLAAKRIVWGKFTNAGQTCIAPDFLYIHQDVKDKLLAKINKHIESMYGKNPLKNPDFTSIVSSGHFDRLTDFLDNGQIFTGGRTDRERLIIEPTIIDNISWTDPVMEEEIFGPILPVLTFENLTEAVDNLQDKEKPLALYYFGQKEKQQKFVTETLSFGGGCINDTLYHIANPHLPFGGVGSSGMGAYHGKASFETFSHQKSMTKQTTKFDYSIRYPGSKIGLKIIKKLLK
ncbi:aldehyde dehydrogenase [Thalassobacillus devorans]|uniref:Aldehyde dehydrogenase n=1 Tax=Thalassobacillus devorans TaxID=279813 RepID=A0ABQ1NYE3_9BACI|nr:aldehyde dehydrogenase [Thalassobacillus devorans]NIK28397.1 aldehyde dehydrogenase (NAD+) [Thalassobacillus devorans]GGC86624.1 aldehyde dehydrogenase [Thalassobacillus devorans]